MDIMEEFKNYNNMSIPQPATCDITSTVDGETEGRAPSGGAERLTDEMNMHGSNTSSMEKPSGNLEQSPAANKKSVPVGFGAWQAFLDSTTKSKAKDPSPISLSGCLLG